jgi:hypothetical protein
MNPNEVSGPAESTSVSRRAYVLLLLALSIAIPLIVNFDLMRVGMNLLHSDFAAAISVSDLIRRGQWTPFAFAMDYAGTTLTNLRALFAAFWEATHSAPDSDWTGQMIFSYLLSPMLLSASVFYLLSRYCSRVATVIVGAVFAAGLQFLVQHWGNDTYLLYLCFGCGLLGFRARYANPWAELTSRQLFATGVACGVAAYTSRISMIYVVAFLVPLPYFLEQLRWMTRAHDRVDGWLRALGAVMLGLFVYLESFGPDIGTVGGKMIRLHADPNLRIFVWIQLLRYARRAYALRATEAFVVNARRAAIALGGLLLGMTPEWIHRIHGQYRIQEPPRTYNFQDAFTILGRVPLALKEIFGAGPTLGQMASCLLVVGGLAALGTLARRQPRLRPAAFSAILITGAFCRIYMYEFGHVVYLLPILPAVALGIGLLWDLALSRRAVAALALLGLLTAGHLYAHLRARAENVAQARDSGNVARAREIVEVFRAEHVRVVITSHYWDSNQYTVFARENPYFTFAQREAIRHPRAVELAASEPRIGVIFRPEQETASPMREYDAYGKHWRLRFLRAVGKLNLYTAEELAPLRGAEAGGSARD